LFNKFIAQTKNINREIYTNYFFSKITQKLLVFTVGGRKINEPMFIFGQR